jgi:predicted nucleic acid-binding protein
MSIIDTSLLQDRVSEGKPIDEDVSIVSIIEYPAVAEYKYFHGKILYPELADLELARQIQKKLVERGRMKGAADLIISAMCINTGNSL